MTWKMILLGILKGMLAFFADEFDPPSRHAKKEAPPRPPQAPNPEGPFSGGWGAASEPAPVEPIRVETDAGSTVSSASFIGDECFGIVKVEKERLPGESRRARRKSQSAVEEMGAVRDWASAPRHPRMVEFAESVRRESKASHALQQEAARRAADIERAAKTLANLPGSARRMRAGGPFVVSQLTPDSVIRLVAGEPLRYVPKAA